MHPYFIAKFSRDHLRFVSFVICNDEIDHNFYWSVKGFRSSNHSRHQHQLIDQTVGPYNEYFHSNPTRHTSSSFCWQSWLYTPSAKLLLLYFMIFHALISIIHSPFSSAIINFCVNPRFFFTYVLAVSCKWNLLY